MKLETIHSKLYQRLVTSAWYTFRAKGYGTLLKPAKYKKDLMYPVMLVMMKPPFRIMLHLGKPHAQPPLCS